MSRRPPQQRLFALVGATLMAAVLAAVLVSAELAEQDLRDQTEERIGAASEAVAQSADERMRSLVELLTSYARRTTVRTIMANDPAVRDLDFLRAILSELVVARPGLLAAAAVDQDGTVVAGAPTAGPLVSPVDGELDWLDALRERGTPTAVTREVGSAWVVDVGQDIHSAGPVPPEGEVLGSLAGTYELRDLADEFTGVARAGDLVIELTDRDDRTLAGAGEAPTGRTMVATTSLETVPWRVSVSVSEADALATAKNVRTAGLVSAAFLGLLILALITALRSAHRRGLAAERNARAVIEAANDAYVAAGPDGLITEWNPAATRTFGWVARDAVGRPLVSTLIAPDDRDRMTALLGAGHVDDDHEDNRRLEVQALHRDGFRFPVEATVSDIAGAGTALFLHDISERVAAATALGEARDAAVDAARLKSDFLASMSHEIRTPMNGVIGMISLLLETELTQEQYRYATAVRGSAEALLAILNDILDFSKIEAGRLDVENIDFEVRTVIDDVAALFGEAAAQKGVELAVLVDPGLPERVTGDPGRLRQVLANLIGNAVKFTPEGEVVVRAMAVDTRDSSRASVVRFDVSDTGIGIEPEVAAALFQPYTQADASTSRQFGGTGLGLAISKQLVELMGGEIGVTSEPGRGSTFWFAIPLAPAADSRDPLPARFRGGVAGLRALVVDDNATNRHIVQQQLRSIGVVTSEAASGTEALARLDVTRSDQVPDVLFLDLNMPGLSGLEVAREIRRRPALANLDVVVLTSTPEPSVSNELRRLGVAGELAKPIRHRDLFDVLGAVTGTPASAGGRQMVTTSVLAEQYARARSGVRVLVAEDNPVNQELATRVLSRRGFDVTVVANGQEAVDVLEREAFDIVLMDCQMPVLDGFAATQAIRRAETDGRHIPIVGVTASARKEDEERCLSAGMDGFLAKPYRPDELVAVLDRWVPVGEGDAPAGSPTGNDDGVSTNDDLPPAVDVTSLAGLREDGLLDEIVGLFRTEGGARVDEIAEAAAAGDVDRFKSAAHRLRGSAGIFGATRLMELCAAAEETPDDPPSQADAIRAEYARALAALS